MLPYLVREGEEKELEFRHHRKIKRGWTEMVWTYKEEDWGMSEKRYETEKQTKYMILGRDDRGEKPKKEVEEAII